MAYLKMARQKRSIEFCLILPCQPEGIEKLRFSQGQLDLFKTLICWRCLLKEPRIKPETRI